MSAKAWHKKFVRYGFGMSAKDAPRLSGGHDGGGVQPDPHGNREERRAFKRLYGDAKPEEES